MGGAIVDSTVPVSQRTLSEETAFCRKEPELKLGKQVTRGRQDHMTAVLLELQLVGRSAAFRQKPAPRHRLENKSPCLQSPPGSVELLGNAR